MEDVEATSRVLDALSPQAEGFNPQNR